jgi:SRSO17 transposase
MYQEQEMGPASECAFVIDDTSQSRAGRKVEGTSCYFDHTQGRHRKGHQVPQLGLAGSKGFLPIEAQLVMGEKGAIQKPKDKPFKDQRSSAARDMHRAGRMTKHELFRDMLRRALLTGFRARSVLADAWFGCKENIRCCLDLKLKGHLSDETRQFGLRVSRPQLYRPPIVCEGSTQNAAQESSGTI